MMHKNILNKKAAICSAHKNCGVVKVKASLLKHYFE